MVKKCAFCRRNADSREHIFSDWMLEMLPPGERYQFTERVVKRNEFVRYHGRKVQIKAKVVCWQCNNGWMSALEGCLKKAIGHILFDDTRIAILTPTETATIAAFGFKTLVIANHKDLTAPPFFTS